MFQLGASAEEIITKVINFFDETFVSLADLWYWPIIMVGLMLVAVLTMSILVGCSYENRILKAVNKINIYFLQKPFITEDNLVEFNLKMKKVPKVLRNNWQIYMLNREDAPTTYINSNTCIDKPLRTSSIEKNLGNFSIFTILLVFISFITGLQYARTYVGDFAHALFIACIVPLCIILVYTIFVLIIKAVKNDIYNMLYDNFPMYERNLTKAVSTLPSYVDYEILFTRQEIKEGIPILQQYLEKRALIEQQELEKARANAVACEEYNFDELGIDGSLVLERAMKECETFIKTKRRLQEECDQIETEKENYKKNYETAAKDYQRKLQASRENLESLKAQQESSTNRIEANYIKKQQGDEIKKQQQLEKDSEEAAAKFNEEQISLQQEIEKRQQEIEEKKLFVQQAMLLEFKHYANTLYKALGQKAAEVGNQKLMNLAQENSDLKVLINDMQGVGGTEVNVQDNLINQEEVSSQSLYEMTSGEQAELESGREEVLIETQPEVQAEEVQPETQSEIQPVVQPADTDVDTANDNAGDDSSTDDGGKQMQETIVEVQPNEVKPEEDLDSLQKQIEEENAKLQAQQQALESDLNNTISKIDATVETQPEPVVEEAVAEVQPEQVVADPVVETQPEPIAEQEPVAEPQPKPTVAEPEEEVEEEPVRSAAPRSSSRRPAAKRPATSRSTANRSASSSRSRSTRGGSAATARKATSEIDALNAEMQKLLDSTKK
ncbi:MAG: hypothetical protein IJD48_01475 [Clostridia bacterium]|nr:hypothetical protein [Clostridia bacterium]